MIKQHKSQDLSLSNVPKQCNYCFSKNPKKCYSHYYTTLMKSTTKSPLTHLRTLKSRMPPVCTHPPGVAVVGRGKGRAGGGQRGRVVKPAGGGVDPEIQTSGQTGRPLGDTAAGS